MSGSRETEFDVNQDTDHGSYCSKKPKKHSKASTLGIFYDSCWRAKNPRAFIHKFSSAMLSYVGFIKSRIQNPKLIDE